MGIITNENIFEFCRLYDWQEKLDALESILLPERWNFINVKPNAKNEKNPILESYIKYTFKRICQIETEEPNIIALSSDQKYACFNLGLFTKEYERVYFLMKEQSRAKDDKNWSFVGFEKESSPALFCFDELPPKVNFIKKVEDLVFDINTPIRINSAHILSNQDNVARLPAALQTAPNLQTIFEGAVQLAIKKVEANYKTAVPQYYDGRIQFLLPLSLSGDLETVDVVMAISKINGFYRGNTCLTLDMAYNNARLIAKPDTPWLLTATGEDTQK